MYPDAPLTALAAQKAAVRTRIAVERAKALGASRDLRPALALLDRGVSVWQRLPAAKWIAVPAGLFVYRQVRRRFGSPLRWLKYVPVAVQMGGTLKQMWAARRRRAPGETATPAPL